MRIMIGGFHSYTISTIKAIILTLATFGTWYPSFKFQYLTKYKLHNPIELDKYSVLKKIYFVKYIVYIYILILLILNCFFYPEAEFVFRYINRPLLGCKTF